MISNVEKQLFKTFFNESGYVLNFSTAEFDNFTFNSVNVALCDKYGLSKGKSFQCFIDEASDADIIKLIADLVEYIEVTGYDLFSDIQKRQFPKVKAFITKNSSVIISLEKISSEIVSDFGNEYINKQVALMLELADSNPTDSIGKAKELLESCFKHILDKLNIDYTTGSDINYLRKEVFKALKLDTKSNNAAQSDENVRKILASFSQIIEGLNMLRNSHGDGHGKGSTFRELPSRYANLAVYSSLTIVQFIWRTFKEQKPDLH